MLDELVRDVADGDVVDVELSLFAQHLQSRRGKYIEQLSNYSSLLPRVSKIRSDVAPYRIGRT